MKARERQFSRPVSRTQIEAKIHDGDTSGILTNLVISPFVWEVLTT
jgi:hypothetical protein